MNFKNLFKVFFLLFSLSVFAQEPIPFRKDSLWGFCNAKKEIFIQCKYNRVNRFFDYPSTVACYSDSCEIISRAGVVLNDKKYEYLKRYKDFYYVKNQDKWGVLNIEGEIILPIQYEKINYIQGLFFASKKEYDSIVFNDTNYLMENDRLYYKIDADTHVVYFDIPIDSMSVDPEFDDVSWAYTEDSLGNTFIDGLYLYKPDLFEIKHEVYNKVGNYIGGIEVPSDWSLGQELIAIKHNGKWGFIDSSLKTIIPFKYEIAKGFCNGLARVKFDGKWGFVNMQDSVIVPFEFDELYNFTGDYFWGKKNRKWALFNSDLKQITDYDFSRVSYFEEGLAYVRKNSKWGYVDHKGDVVIDFQYEMAFEFSENLAHVCSSDSTCGYINKKGKVKIPLVYEKNYGGEFNEGLAEIRVKKEGEYYYGFINKKGKSLILPEYKTCSDYNGFYKGLGMLEFPNDNYNINYKKLFYFDSKGNIFYE